MIRPEQRTGRLAGVHVNRVLLAVIVLMLVVVGTNDLLRARDTYALPDWLVQVMPSNASGGTHYRLHFDDGSRGARDFSHSNSAYLRDYYYSKGSYNYNFRFQYWNEGDCRVRGRLQQLSGGVWLDYYDSRWTFFI